MKRFQVKRGRSPIRIIYADSELEAAAEFFEVTMQDVTQLGPSSNGYVGFGRNSGGSFDQVVLIKEKGGCR